MPATGAADPTTRQVGRGSVANGGELVIPQVDEVMTEIVWELTGLNDIKKCIQDPAASDCLWAVAAALPVGKLKSLKSLEKIDDIIKRTRAGAVTSCVRSTARSGASGGIVCNVLAAGFDHAWDQHAFGGKYHQERKTQNVFASGIDRIKLRSLIDEAIAKGKAVSRNSNDDRTGHYIDYNFFDDDPDLVVGLNGQTVMRIVVDGNGTFLTAMPKW